MNKLTDDKLVALYIEGNDNAFDILLNRHQGKIFNYIYRSVKNQELAEDLFQDTFVKVVMCLRQGKYTENGKFGNWIMRLTRNMLMDHCRHLSSSTNINTISTDDNDSDSLNNRTIATYDNPEAELCEMQTLSNMEYLITLLPEEQQDIIRMRVYEERSFKEISELLGISINTALGRMHYATNNLKKYAIKKGLTA